jgi:CDP-glucose 4,6-dehydratase
MNLEHFLSNAFHGKTVFITGHTGFKGGWLTLWLESLGAKIIGFSLDPPTSPSFFQETGLKDLVQDIRGDILDKEKIFEIVDTFHPDFIFHLAAQPLVRASYEKPRETFNVNVMGTINILEAIRVSQFPTTCVCITSDKCYENKEWVYAYRENDSLGGHDPYSASKGAAEIAIAAYRKSFFNPENTTPDCTVSSARAGNIIGGGDWAGDRLVPDCVRSLAKGDTIKIRNPMAIRPWQFVLDPLLGYLVLALKMKENPLLYSDSWNFGPNYSNTINVQKLTEMIIREWGYGNWEVSSADENTLHEADYLKLDIAKSMTKLEWKPVYPIDLAVHKTIRWYKEYCTREKNMKTFSLEQIREFTRNAEKIF